MCENNLLNVKSHVDSVPDEVIIQELIADSQGLQDVTADLCQELTVCRKGLWVGVAALVGAKFQQHCGEGGIRDKQREESMSLEETNQGTEMTVEGLETSLHHFSKAIFSI